MYHTEFGGEIITLQYWENMVQLRSRRVRLDLICKAYTNHPTCREVELRNTMLKCEQLYKIKKWDRQRI